MTATAVHAGRGAHLPAIEGMRALAILLVVAYHAGLPWISGGYVGVDVFFVLSGYLIIGLLERELRDTGTIALVSFWARRARRLLPAAAVVIVTTLVAGGVILPPQLQRQAAAAALASSTYLSNLWFAWRATDYLGDEGANPLLHTWSLSVEEQFYVAWPLLVAVLGAIVALRRVSSGTRVAWLAGAVSVASFGWALMQQPVASSWAFFSPLTRAWEFGIGGVIAIAGQRHAPSPRARWLAGVAGIAAIIGAAASFHSTTAMPGVPTLLPVLGAALLLLVVPREDSGSVVDPYYWLSVTPMRWIGRVSYSWYLWHWPVSVLLVTAVQVDTIGLWLAGALLSLALAEATRRWVEDPIRFHPGLALRPRLVLVGSAGMVLALSGASHGSRARSMLPAPGFPPASPTPSCGRRSMPTAASWRPRRCAFRNACRETRHRSARWC